MDKYDERAEKIYSKITNIKPKESLVGRQVCDFIAAALRDARASALEEAAKVAESPIVNFEGCKSELCYECDCHGECPQTYIAFKIRTLKETK